MKTASNNTALLLDRAPREIQSVTCPACQYRWQISRPSTSVAQVECVRCESVFTAARAGDEMTQEARR